MPTVCLVLGWIGLYSTCSAVLFAGLCGADAGLLLPVLVPLCMGVVAYCANGLREERTRRDGEIIRAVFGHINGLLRRHSIPVELFLRAH